MGNSYVYSIFGLSLTFFGAGDCDWRGIVFIYFVYIYLSTLKNVTLVSNKKSIVVEMFDFAVTKVDNFCKNELTTVMFKPSDGKDTSLVLFKP